MLNHSTTSSLSEITLVRSTTQPFPLYLTSLSHSRSWKLNHSTASFPNCGLSPSLILISFLQAQPLNQFISQLWCFSPSLPLISLLNAQPLNHFISLWYHSCEINHSTISPISDISLPHSLWYHSWKLNHSTTSSPNCGLSPSLTLISLQKAQPLNYFMTQLQSFSPPSLSEITLVKSTTQPLHIAI